VYTLWKVGRATEAKEALPMSANWFGGRLRDLREAAGLTRQELAEKAGLKAGGVRDIEQGRRSPQWETVLALCGALNCSCEEFRKEPADRPKPQRGRPRKAAAEAAERPTPKRPKGRPRKGK
jgi:transcriptional regulator with XRE-family HTH domain